MVNEEQLELVFGCSEERLRFIVAARIAGVLVG
jgi:hypothetical protein